MMWTIEDALSLIRQLQPKAMEAGWCLMLGGGVLNNGYSDNDLDLLAYPRNKWSYTENLTDVFQAAGWSPVKIDFISVASIVTFTSGGKKIELIHQAFSAQGLDPERR